MRPQITKPLRGPDLHGAWPTPVGDGSHARRRLPRFVHVVVGARLHTDAPTSCAVGARSGRCVLCVVGIVVWSASAVVWVDVLIVARTTHMR